MTGRYNIVLVGVGGQGLLTVGRIIGNAAIAEGVEVTIAETHGLSQRGGSLMVQIRLGPGSSPMVPVGAADLLMGLEALETARYISYANKETRVVMNKFLWPPPLTKTPSLENIIDVISSRLKLYVVDANTIAEKETGMVLTANTVLLGAAYAIDRGLRERLSRESIEEGLKKVFRGRILELNTKAFYAGYREGEKLAKETTG